MDISSGKRWRTEEKVSILREPQLSQSIPFSSIRITINLALQDIVLLQEGFTEYMNHVENGKELRSIVNHGLIPGRISLKTGRHAVFFTVVNPMVNQDGSGETLCDLSQARIAPQYLETLSGYSILVQSEARSTKRTAISSNKVKRSILCDTLLAEFIEKAICMKTKEQLYQSESVILRPRVVLEANSQSGSQRSTCTGTKIILGIARRCGELRGNPNYRIPGISISTVKLQDARRQNNVTKLSEMFEKHRHEEQFLIDISQKQEINRFSEESQQLLVDMNHTEIFKLC